MSAAKQIRSILRILIVVVVAGSPLLAWKAASYRVMLGNVPDAMRVWKIEYRAEKNWGIGPGGNETGILVYTMPKHAAVALSRDGFAYLGALPKNNRRVHWQGNYTDWKACPIIDPDHRWSTDPNCFKAPLYEKSGCNDIVTYLDKYGFMIDVDPEILGLTNSILQSEGGYYAFGRAGFILLSPERRKIIYAYAG